MAIKRTNRLAGSGDVCGGHIRNIVLTAAVLALADVLHGLGAEYRKLGKQVPPALKVRARDRRGARGGA